MKKNKTTTDIIHMLRKVQNSLFKYTTQQIYVEITKLNFTDHANSEPVVEIQLPATSNLPVCSILSSQLYLSVLTAWRQ